MSHVLTLKIAGETLYIKAGRQYKDIDFRFIAIIVYNSPAFDFRDTACDKRHVGLGHGFQVNLGFGYTLAAKWIFYEVGKNES